MDRTTSPNNVAGQFTDGDPQTGVGATFVTADDMNSFQEEIVRTIEYAGLTPLDEDLDQLRQAIQILVGQGAPSSQRSQVDNGQMRFWQRGTVVSGNDATIIGADRWAALLDTNGGTAAIQASRQDMAPGTIDDDPAHFMRIDQSGGISGAGGATKVGFEQRIADVRTLNNREVVFSCWLKAGAAEPLTVVLEQNFGSGGSAAVVTSTVAWNATTSWQRLTASWTLPDLAGKTLGTDHYLAVRVYSTSQTGLVLDVANAQLEAGSNPTSFEEVAFAADLLRCQQYFEKSYDLETPPGTATAAGMSTGHEPGLVAQTINTRFLAYKARIPEVRWWDAAGTANRIDWEGGSRFVTQTNDTSRQRTGSPEVGVTRADSVVQGHWAAEAELY